MDEYELFLSRGFCSELLVVLWWLLWPKRVVSFFSSSPAVCDMTYDSHLFHLSIFDQRDQMRIMQKRKIRIKIDVKKAICTCDDLRLRQTSINHKTGISHSQIKWYDEAIQVSDINWRETNEMLIETVWVGFNCTLFI